MQYFTTWTFKQKLEYQLLNKNDDIPIELDISKWTTFRPPLKQIELGTIENITDAFKEEFLKNIKSGNKDQEQQINVIKGKIQQFSISSIFLIVRKAKFP